MQIIVVLKVMPLMFCVQGVCPLFCFNHCLTLNRCCSRGQAVNTACVVGSKPNLLLSSCWLVNRDSTFWCLEGLFRGCFLISYRWDETYFTEWIEGLAKECSSQKHPSQANVMWPVAVISCGPRQRRPTWRRVRWFGYVCKGCGEALKPLFRAFCWEWASSHM